MNQRFAKYLLTLCAGVLTLSAGARSLAPNAEILLSKRDALNSQHRVAAADTVVGAYVLADDKNALNRLEELGASIRADYGHFATASIPLSVLREAASTEGIRYIALGNEVKLLNDYGRKVCGIDDIHANEGNRLPMPYKGEGIVLGVIDNGVEFAHTAFRDSDGKGLRIKRVWLQKSSRGKAPEAFGYGTEYTTSEEILSVTYDDPFGFHGAHTMGIAGGSDMKSKYYGVAPESELVYVGFNNDDTCIADAIAYIFDYADSVGKPCVINMSLGQHMGPHNGTSLLDRYIDSSTGPGRVIVGAVGNEGNTRLHATKTFTEGDTRLKTMLVFSEESSNKLHYLDIWGSEGTNMKVSLCVAQSLKGQIVAQSPVFDTSVENAGIVDSYFTIASIGASAYFTIDGEVSPINGQPHVMVECTVDNLTDGRILGIIIDGEPGQTVDLWNYSGNEFASNGKPGWTDGTTEGTAGEIGGTAKNIISVGSYDARSTITWIDGAVSRMENTDLPYKQNERSFFSSCGPTADGRIVPDILAPGFPVVSAINKHAFNSMGQDLSLYTCSATRDSDGSRYYYSYQMGTSMSAPFVAGTVALMLQANPDLTPDDVKKILVTTAKTAPYMGLLPNNYYGNGFLNSFECVRMAVDKAGVALPGASGDNAAKVWTDGSGNLTVVAPDGGMARVFSTSGVLLGTFALTETVTTCDVSAWGKGVVVVSVESASATKRFKVVL